jgi:hypothetical protein
MLGRRSEFQVIARHDVAFAERAAAEFDNVSRAAARNGPTTRLNISNHFEDTAGGIDKNDIDCYAHSERMDCRAFLEPQTFVRAYARASEQANGPFDKVRCEFNPSSDDCAGGGIP